LHGDMNTYAILGMYGCVYKIIVFTKLS